MNEETRLATLGSIEKWKNIEDGTGEDQGTNNCPLCSMFLDLYCDGCPVRKTTGIRCCEGSPYDLWTDHIELVHDGDFWENGSYKVFCPECKTLATAEREFLEGLLED